MVPQPARTHLWLAALLLLVQAFLPGLHRWQHQGEHAGSHRAAGPACCGTCDRPDATPAVDGCGHDHAHDCSVCVLLAQCRDWLGGEKAAAPAAAPSCGVLRLWWPAVVDAARPWPVPPVRGPPAA